jgi:hypothetical protein
MSTVKTINIVHPSGSTTNIVNDASGNITVGGTLAMSSSFMRNRIINGAMVVDQRNAGAAQTFTAAAAIAYNVDRFYGSCTGANVTGQRVAGPTGFQYCYQFTGAASVTGILFGQRIESYNCADLVNQNVTISANISNSLLTTVTWTAYYANTTDTFSSKTQIATGTFTVSSTATTYQATFNAGANAANGIAIEFTVGSQTSGTWKITGVQLEVGSVATPFEREIYSNTLAKCQRYYQQSYPVGTVVGDTSGLGLVGGTAMNNGANNAGNNGVPISFKVPMRATATVTTYAAFASTSAAITIAKASTPAATYSATADNASANGFKVFSTATGSGGTAGTATEFLLQYIASAEL